MTKSKEINKLINKYDKTLIYYHYLLVVGYENAKQYERITKAKMIEEIREKLLSNPELIIKTIDYRAIKRLRKIVEQEANNEIVLFNYSESLDIYDLQKLFALDYTDEQITVTLDVKHLLAEVLDDRELLAYDYYKHVVKGMLHSYGILTYELIDELYNRLSLAENPEHFYVSIEDDKTFIDALRYQDYLVYTNAIAHPEFDEVEHSLNLIEREYSLDFYYNLSKLGYPLQCTEKVAEYNKTAEHKYFGSTYTMAKSIHSHDTFMDVIERLRNSNDNENDYERLMNEIYLNWPLWNAGGLTIKELESRQSRKYDGSKLEHEMMIEFVNYFNNFAYFANQKLKLVDPNLNFEEFIYEVTAEKTDEIIRKSVFNRAIINQYINLVKNAPYVNMEAFNNALKGAILVKGGTFVGYDNESLAMIKTKKRVYHVTGVSKGIDSIFKDLGSCKVDLIILPLEDTLTYFFFASTYEHSNKQISLSEYENLIDVFSIKDIIKYS